MSDEACRKAFDERWHPVDGNTEWRWKSTEMGEAWRLCWKLAQAASEQRIAKLREALEVYAQFDVKHKVEGGVFDPKLGTFRHSTLSEYNGNPASEALAEDDKL